MLGDREQYDKWISDHGLPQGAHGVPGVAEPHVEVLVVGVSFEGGLRMWTQHEDASWQGDVQWWPNGEPTLWLDTFTTPVQLRHCDVGVFGRLGYFTMVASCWTGPSDLAFTASLARPPGS